MTLANSDPVWFGVAIGVLIGMVLYAGLGLLVLILGTVQFLMIKAFLREHAEIRADADLDAFKTLARRSMYLTIAAMPILGLQFLIGLLISLAFGCSGVAVVLLVCGVIVGIGQWIKAAEEQVRSLECHESLEEEYEAVCHAWVKKLLPDF